MRVVSFVVAITCFTCLPAYSTLLNVSASATIAAGSTALVTDFESATRTFILLVTGGTGTGFATADLALDGTSNESNGLLTWGNGIATATWPTFMEAGSPFGDAGNVSPFFFCTPENPACTVQFTFGVPQTFSMTLTASAKMQANASAPKTTSDMTAHTDAEFGGLFAFRTCPIENCGSGGLVCADYSLADVIVPEPASWVLTGIPMLLLALVGGFAKLASRR